METWLPRLTPTTQWKAESRVGGLPVGFPSAQWPRCRRCGAPMTLLVQLIHTPPMIDLCADGRTLYVFQCADLDRQGCRAFGDGDGGSACFVLGIGERGDEATEPPPSQTTHAPGWRLTEWRREEDLNEDPDDLEDGEENPPSSLTKAGGAPFWIQQDATPPGPWRFVFQLETAGLDGWMGIAGAGIASIFLRSDGVLDARVVWQDS